jgi:AraC-like DNA-binding protein
MSPAAPLADVVEAFLDWEVQHAATASSMSVRTLPCSAPQLCVHYRSTAWASRAGGCFYRHIAVGIQTESASVRTPSGSLGVLVTRLKPEAAARLIGVPLNELTDSSVGMRELFGAGPVSLLEEQLAEARSSLERVTRVEAFLEARLMESQLLECGMSPAMYRAAQMLRNDPALSGQHLAEHLDMSERHLSRCFSGLFGTSPKQFARIARISKLVRARWNGHSWADIAHTLGFFDQSHMINDFKSMVGVTPTRFFAIASGQQGALNSLLGRSVFCNLLVSGDLNILGSHPSPLVPRYL